MSDEIIQEQDVPTEEEIFEESEIEQEDEGLIEED